ncbi:MAG: hypothetical protein QG652_624 [Pseudomonadota bacterium]|nr:hypothetical protein [Pseudomonadota bacterium]
MQTLNKLLLLIIALGLLIGIFSRPEHQHDNKTPWNIQRLPDGHIHVFGITPGKTTVQEANQILGHFAATRLHNTEPAQLIATHENMMLGEEMAQLDLQYQIDETELAYMQQSSTVFSPCQPVQLTTEDEIALLNTPIAKIIYTPVTDYSTNKVEHHFDEADEIRQINETQQIMFYREIGLTVYINSDKPDVFVYESR